MNSAQPRQATEEAADARVACPAPVRVGVAGCGAMGSAILNGLAPLAREGTARLFAWNRSPEPVARLAAQNPPVAFCASLEDLAREADILFLCVKPPYIADLAARASRAFPTAERAARLLVSIAPAPDLAALRQAADEACLVARIMPTTTLAVGQGVFALTMDAACPERVRACLTGLLKTMGAVYEMSEEQLLSFSAAVGCAPGFIFHLLQGLMDGAVALGIPRPDAVEMMLKTTMGCALLAEQKGVCVRELRDQVASPAGMTIQGLNVLERAGCNGHIMDAMAAAFAKGKELNGG